MQTSLRAPVQQESKHQTASIQRKTVGGELKQFDFEDRRPEAVTQRKLSELVNGSARVVQQEAVAQGIGESAFVVQQKEDQLRVAPVQLARQAVSKPNRTGLPDRLKSGVEALSGMSMDHVRVHYNSSQPAQLNAHAYAQGSEIHIGPGQEKHLPHEAWHVVQQAQGRVRATKQMKTDVAVNDDIELEAEADVMGERALGVVRRVKQENFGKLDLTLVPVAVVPRLGERVAGINVQLVKYPKKKRKRLQHTGHKRSRTAFGYTTGTRKQGPHSLAHIAVATAIDQGELRGRDPFDLLDTKAAPRTRIANKLLRDELPGNSHKAARHRFLKAYLKLRHKAKDKGKRNLRDLQKVTAASPLATYGLSTGTYTQSEISGKGERSHIATKDFKKLLSKRYIKKKGKFLVPAGTRTFDFRGNEANDRWRLHYAQVMATFASTDDSLSGAEDIGSESDTDMELDSDTE